MRHFYPLSVSLEALPDTFTTRVALGRGVHQRRLYGWRDSGEIVELSRGVFRRADAPPASHPDLLAISYHTPQAVVCCVSAAATQDLIDQLPVAVQIAVPTRQRPPQIAFPPTDVFRFDSSTFEVGQITVEAAPGEQVRIYDPARTVVDLVRLRHRFGEPVAYAALRRCLERTDARPGILLRTAETLGVSGPLRRALDAVTAG